MKLHILISVIHFSFRAYIYMEMNAALKLVFVINMR
jgi:hypothetical protein